MNNTFQVVPLHKLAPSPLNPRKTFDPLKLQELADSIASKGIIEPLVVRPHQNGGPAMFEIVAGERRYRASELAKVSELPCIVRELDDVEVLEIVAIENGQREDVHPLEEAEGYAALMKAAGYDVEQIAGKIGRSTKYVYDRVKLLQLIPELRDVFLSTEITAGHAVQLARLTPADQRSVMGDPKDDYYDGGLFDEDYDDDAPELELGGRPRYRVRSVRELGDWIKRHVRLRTDDAELPELFPETAVALQEAGEAKLEVVHITRNWNADKDDDGPRIYTNNQWKRADGKAERYGDPTTSCDRSALGVIVVGDDQGDAFKVCVDKKCDVHWKKERSQGSSSGGTTDYAARDRKWREQQKRQDAERARWKKATPKLLEMLAEKLGETPWKDLVEAIEKRLKPYGFSSKAMKVGKTPEDALRYLTFLTVADRITNEYSVVANAPKALQPYGIDAKKIVDQVAPKPKEEKKAKPKASAKKKPGARARRRAKKAKGA